MKFCTGMRDSSSHQALNLPPGRECPDPLGSGGRQGLNIIRHFSAGREDLVLESSKETTCFLHLYVLLFATDKKTYLGFFF